MALRKRRRLSFIVYLVLITFLVGGCASKYGKQITDVKYCPECYQPIQDLRNAEKQFNTTVAGSVVAGALLGALVGAIATGKVQGAAAGAVVGGIAGGAAGYAIAKQRQIKDDNARLASYLQDLDGDISGLDRVTAAAQVARKCYDRKFQETLAEYKEQKITRAVLDERYQEIQNGTLEASQILGTVITGASTKEAQYQEALKSEALAAKRDIPQPVFAPEPAPAPEPEPAKGKKGKRANVSKKLKKAEPEAEPKPLPNADTAAQAKKPPVVETGDKLTDISTRNARFAGNIKDAQDEKAELEKAQAERKKTLEQLTG
ncbi:MAG: glycine zipper domain-containing protein [Solidesulfovibrio sp. DCME]|uniref:glycine zipper domain-containing protein n=1 Tax=Solidesulfovibrio sp. DCME TaxID=3447380 RepID=UPI003D11C039